MQTKSARRVPLALGVARLTHFGSVPGRPFFPPAVARRTAASFPLRYPRTSRNIPADKIYLCLTCYSPRPAGLYCDE